MYVYFKDGRSVWFHEARGAKEEGDLFIVLGKRGCVIAEIMRPSMAFWCYDNQDLTAYGWQEMVG